MTISFDGIPRVAIRQLVTRNLAILSITPEAILEILQDMDGTRLHLAVNPPPEGTKIVGASVNILSGCIELLLEHPSFPKVMEGCLATRLEAITEVWVDLPEEYLLLIALWFEEYGYSIRPRKVIDPTIIYNNLPQAK